LFIPVSGIAGLDWLESVSLAGPIKALEDVVEHSVRKPFEIFKNFPREKLEMCKKRVEFLQGRMIYFNELTRYISNQVDEIAREVNDAINMSQENETIG